MTLNQQSYHDCQDQCNKNLHRQWQFFLLFIHISFSFQIHNIVIDTFYPESLPFVSWITARARNTLPLTISYLKDFFHRNLLPFCNFVSHFIHFRSVSVHRKHLFHDFYDFIDTETCGNGISI